MSETFGEFVKRKRRSAGLTLRSFSAAIGISPVYISNIEWGKRYPPNGEVIGRMADVLSLNIRERDKLFDLAAQSKDSLSTPYDISCYINSHKVVKKAIRLADRKGVSDELWQALINDISKVSS